jgi:hypothetical protein
LARAGLAPGPPKSLNGVSIYVKIDSVSKSETPETVGGWRTATDPRVTVAATAVTAVMGRETR